ASGAGETAAQWGATRARDLRTTGSRALNQRQFRLCNRKRGGCGLGDVPRAIHGLGKKIEAHELRGRERNCRAIDGERASLRWRLLALDARAGVFRSGSLRQQIEITSVDPIAGRGISRENRESSLRSDLASDGGGAGVPELQVDLAGTAAGR